MKLSWRKIGGVAGAAGAVTQKLDLDTLPAAERAHACALVDAAELFARAQRILLPHPRPWDFRYVLDVEAAGKKHEIELHLDAADKPLRALIEWLENRDDEPDDA